MSGAKIIPEPPEERPPGGEGRTGSGGQTRGRSAHRGRQGGWYRGTSAETAGLVPSNQREPACRPAREGQIHVDRRTTPFRPRSTCPPSSARCSTLWREHDTFERSLDRRPRTPPGGRSTRARRPPTACPAPTTSRPGCSRTCSRGSRPCRATSSSARPAGTATACRSSSPSRRSSASPASRTSRRTASRSSTPGAASRCSATWTSSSR